MTSKVRKYPRRAGNKESLNGRAQIQKLNLPSASSPTQP
jgi:hypothetical protein